MTSRTDVGRFVLKIHIQPIFLRNQAMKQIAFLVAVTCLVFSSPFSEAKEPKYTKLVLSDQFYAEGAYYGDFNKDGFLDVVAGPFWYEGPDFTKKHEIFTPESFDPEGYSDCFGMFVADLNGDGWDDVFVCPHPGTHSYWYENPRGKDGHWKKHMALEELGNESQEWVNMTGNGKSGPIYNTMQGLMGYGTYEIKDGNPEWTFHAVTPKDDYFQRYTHGIGAGDINGDGRFDMLESRGWWEQPENPSETPWKFHPAEFAQGGAHLLVFDVDGDGLNDVVCAWNCHIYGLVWHKQIRDNDGNISWKRTEILPIEPDKHPGALSFSQMHAFVFADMNGDGLPDIVTGKRWWAHGSKGDVEANNPSVLYWFELKRDGQGGATFIPHQIDDNSGVGTQVCTADLNGDNVPDIIVSNKKGTFVFLSE